MSASASKPKLTSILLITAVIALAGFLFFIQKLLSPSSEDVPIQAQTAPEETGVSNSKIETLELASPDPIKTAEAESESAVQTSITTDTPITTEAAIDAQAKTAKAEANQQPQVDQQSQDDTLQVEANNDPETAITVRTLNTIKVPKSFALRDASKYFVPKEERAPGNLGGPPPFTEEMLNIMEQGSPSGFAPPTAPDGNQ